MQADWFTSQDVCGMAGLSYRCLDYWCRTGVLQPTGATSGSGRYRGWTPDDALAAHLANRLRSTMPLHAIRRFLTAWYQHGCPRAGIWVIEPGGAAEPVPPDPAGLTRSLGRRSNAVTLFSIDPVPAELAAHPRQEVAA